MGGTFLVLVIDGMADHPLAELGDRTPLEAARTPNMDRLAATAHMGRVRTIPEGFEPGSDVANMSLLGYDPRRYYTGRSPFEALSMGLELDPDDTAFRCNLVTLGGDGKYKQQVMVDYSGGEISTTEAQKLIAECNHRLGTDRISFHSGISYRHIMLWKGRGEKANLTPPHNILDQIVGDHLPRGPGAATLIRLMVDSRSFLPRHRVNVLRQQKGLLPANSIWIWGQGSRPELPAFRERYHLRGSVISAVDLVRGLGLAAGLRPVIVPGATGRVDTNFAGKAQAALECFAEGDGLVYLHVEAADEASHHGDLQQKIRAIELVDREVLGRILPRLEEDYGHYALLVLPDHYTPLFSRTHDPTPVPFMLYRKDMPAWNGSQNPVFSERSAREAELWFEEGHRLMDFFLVSGDGSF